MRSAWTETWWVGSHGGTSYSRLAVAEAAGSLLAIAVLLTSALVEGLAQSPAEPEVSSSSSSQSPDVSTASPPMKEWMIAGYGGAPYTYNSDVSVKKAGVQDFTAHDVGWDGEPFIDPIYYGVRVVRWFEGGRTGSMLDFTHSKTLSRLDEQIKFSGMLDGAPAPETAKLRDIFRRLEASHGHNMLTLNGLLRLPALSPRLIPYVGLGAGISLPHSEVQLQKDPGRTYEYQYTGPAVQALIGLEFRVPRMSYFLEYKFTLASYEMPLTHQDGTILFADLWRQFLRWWRDEEPPGGYLETRLTSHQVIGGLGVRFGGNPPAANP